jgi:hypothetical protein
LDKQIPIGGRPIVTTSARLALIARYAEGPARLEAALAQVPEAARQWRPAPGKWSVHEIVVHCADSEANSHMRLRYLLAEDRPAIQGYDQDRWARVMDYHAHPLEPALATIRAVRANTLALLQRMGEAEWARTGTHSESGAYGAEDWLRIYAEHLHVHERQVLRTLAAWGART